MSDVVNNQETKPKSRAKKLPSKYIVIIAISAIAIICGLLIAYVFNMNRYHDVFLPGTVINGIDAHNKTPDEIRQQISSQISDYKLNIISRNRDDESISGKDIDLEYVFDGSLDKLLAEQDTTFWIANLFKTTDIKIDTMAKANESSIIDAIDKLSCMDASTASSPSNAYISTYEEGTGYSIVPETLGNLITDKAQVDEAIENAILTLEDSIDLTDMDIYQKPAITSEDATLTEVLNNLNTYVKTNINYKDLGIVLDASTIHEWIGLNDDNSINVDKDAIADWVTDLASKVDTCYKPKTLKTTYGPTITITGGSYGWKVNQLTEADYIYNSIVTGITEDRVPDYARTANSHSDPDYGDTYVEINITAQHLYYYKNGSLVVESDFVSGNTSKGRGTPAGAYPVAYKQRNATLRGEGYATPVSYWMPFNNGIGLHDAGWRSNFGGNIYKTNGSHGCINLPPSVAKTIYENIEAGCPVLCYNLEGTETKPQAVKPAETTAAPVIPETTAVETVPESQTEPETPGTGEVGPGIPTQSAAETPAPVGPGQESVTPSAPDSTVSPEAATGVDGGPGV